MTALHDRAPRDGLNSISRACACGSIHYRLRRDHADDSGGLALGLAGRLRDIGIGQSRARIGRSGPVGLVISEKTARNHAERTYAKIGASNRIGASMYALKHGLGVARYPGPDTRYRRSQEGPT